MRCGILYEGKYDSSTVQNIVAVTARRINPSIHLSFEFIDARGSISGSKDRATTTFFETDPVCNFSVFFHDYDKFPQKLHALKSWRTKYEEKHNPNRKIVFASPKPTLEEWYFREEKAVKTIFKISDSDRIPHYEMHPKSRLKKLYDDKISDPTISLNDIYDEIALTMNPGSPLLLNDVYYKKYCEDLERVIGH